jgi:hypothetical protein
MTDLLNHLKDYSSSVKKWNKATFNDSLYAFPKKGFAPYNQVQKLRQGQDITPLKTVAQMQKPEELIKHEKPKPEAKKETKAKPEAKKEAKAKPEAKKSEKKSKPKKEIVKEKAEKKEKVVKQAIQAIMKEEAPVNQVVATEEAEKAKEDAVPQAYRNQVKSYNDDEYWKKTSPKEKKDYLASVYGMKASDQEYIKTRMKGALEKAYKAYENKMAKAQKENK